MKFIFIHLFFLISIFSLDVPNLSSRVIDETLSLKKQTKIQLNQILKQHYEETTNQIVILLIDTLNGDSIEDFSLRVVEKWKLGKKGKNNGILLMVVKKDKKMRIEVGYGLENVLTDVKSNQISRNVIIPEIKKGDYDKAMTLGIEKIIQTLK